MSGAILTPTAIWKNFSVNDRIEVEQVSKQQITDDYFVSRFYLKGKKVKDGEVKIYCVMARPCTNTSSPAVLILQDFKDSTDETLIGEFAKKGYTAIVVDVGGKYKGREFFTLYPESLAFANYDAEVVARNYVEGEIFGTCWYEWACCIRYAVKYLKDFEDITKIGVLGIGEVATALWDSLSFNEDVDCAVFALNSGWKGYSGIYKFDHAEEPQLDDGRIEYIAGIDPQSYVPHVKCPILMLSATNSNAFDMDRAFDTVSRIHEGQYYAVDFSVGARNCVEYESFCNAVTFFGKYLKEDKKINLPSGIDVSASLENKTFNVKVSLNAEELKTLCVYVAEENVEPQFRSWRKLVDCVEQSDGSYSFVYKPYAYSKRVFFFAKARYENGFTVCSNVICKEFKPEEVSEPTKFKIVYSSRLTNSDSSFFIANEDKPAPYGLEIFKREHVKIVKGPFDMYGISSKAGILTFKIFAEKYNPEEDSILMFDVVGNFGSEVKVSLIADYFGVKIKYNASVKTLSNDFWQNVKFERSNFKTTEGLSLKDYGKIQAIEFVSDSDFIVNNILWV